MMNGFISCFITGTYYTELKICKYFYLLNFYFIKITKAVFILIINASIRKCWVVIEIFFVSLSAVY